MATVIVDGIEVELGRRASGSTAFRPPQRAGVEIPHYCWHPGLSVVASCRMCLVETGTHRRRDRHGHDAAQAGPRLPDAGQRRHGLRHQQREGAADARAMVEEDLLIDHPIDCPICDKAGECSLQDYHFEHGQDERRADIQPFTSRRREMGDTVTLFVDRCVMCTRCVRFTREISGTSELMVINRGSHEEIDVFPGYPARQQAVGQRRRPLPGRRAGRQGLSVPAARLVHEEARQRLHRLLDRLLDHGRRESGPRLSPEAARESARQPVVDVRRRPLRLPPRAQRPSGSTERPQRRDGDRRTLNVEWSHAACARSTSKLRKAGRAGRRALAASDGRRSVPAGQVRPQRRSAGACSRSARFRSKATDETFKNGFTIHAEKCPNRRGVEASRRALHGQRASRWDDFLAERRQPARVGGAVGHRRLSSSDWIDAADGRAVRRRRQLLVVQDLFASPLWERADVSAARRGVRRARRLVRQLRPIACNRSTGRFVRRPACEPKGSVYWQLLGRAGPVQRAARCWTKSPREIAYLRRRGRAGAGRSGVDLKVESTGCEPQ